VRFSVPLNLLGGHRFRDAPGLDQETRKAIIREEIGSPKPINEPSPAPFESPEKLSEGLDGPNTDLDADL
jgi:hypothetical protein